MGRELPEGTKLHKKNKLDVVTSAEYEHWTVTDLIEFLGRYDPRARVWVVDPLEDYEKEDMTIFPIELISGQNGEVYFS